MNAIATPLSLPPIIAISDAMQRAVALMERFAPTGLAILLVGATGTGKELFARHIHYRSRRHGEFIDVNCGALPQEMAESLLFGHRKGAFTGAVETVQGHLERAHHGTLFFDEVLHLSPPSQVKLLRVIETGEVQPLGEGRKRSVDFRILAAAQDDAGEQVENGTFRRDLYQRLAGIVITLPRLADRTADITPLAKHFADERGQVLERGVEEILLGYCWPGNVRELRLAIERAGCLVENGALSAAAVEDAIAMGILRRPKIDTRVGERRKTGSDRRENKAARRSADELLALCHAHDWDTRRVAQTLGVTRSAVYSRLRQAGVSMRAIKKSGI